MNNPTAPTIKTKSGFVILSVSINLLTASIKMEKHNAIRKTAFTNAPKTSARTKPNVLTPSNDFEVVFEN